MICVLLSFTDDPARLELRPQHRERLTEHRARGELLMAGPYDDETGALLLFSTDAATVDAAIAADPYYAAPGVSVSIHSWNPVIGGPAAA